MAHFHQIITNINQPLLHRERGESNLEKWGLQVKFHAKKENHTTNENFLTKTFNFDLIIQNFSEKSIFEF